MDVLSKIISSFGIASMLVGCGSEPEKPVYDRTYWPVDILNETPSGIFAGKPWTMAVAEIKNDATDLSVRLVGAPTEICGIGLPAESHVSFSVPNKVGLYRLSNDKTGGFFLPPNSITIANVGIMDVREVSSTSVTMGVIVESGDDHLVNGTFTADRCP